MNHYYKVPFEFREPKTYDEAPLIVDAHGHEVAMLFWPVHSVEEPAVAERETYELGRFMVRMFNESIRMLIEDGRVPA